ncbi:MAG: dTMP kinase [Planctomycetes bacterium]|nr:dTMP kinase [Planctomycetota bacterium]
MNKGIFITVDGIDGAGKTTQVRLLSDKFRSLNRRFLIIREPGTTHLSERIRKILLDPKCNIIPEAEMLLYLTCRIQLLQEVIMPKIRQGYIIISDRYMSSTLCYQGAGLGLGTQRIKKIWSLITNHKGADLNIILDIPAKYALKRTNRNDRISKRTVKYFNVVAECFRQLCTTNPVQYVLIDATKPSDEVFKCIWSRIAKLI